VEGSAWKIASDEVKKTGREAGQAASISSRCRHAVIEAPGIYRSCPDTG
jgi:hypothetical protein